MAKVDTVTVACKLPHGLKIEEYALREKTELVMGGGTRVVQEAIKTGRFHVINGMAAEAGKMAMTRNEAGLPTGTFGQVLDTGFALTPGVPKDLWEGWLAANKDQPMVRNRLVFAHAQPASVKAMAKEAEKQRTGLEPIDPNNPGGGVEPAEEQKKRMAGQRVAA
jgi:hypothetical protein